ncbi:GPCR, PTH11-type [Xylariaceae sp. FL0662B]|nr:GPCR, PTH11-type [Xylariaceae sp. FL0662B]
MSASSADSNVPQLSPAEQGALLSAAAYAEPPIKPQGLALILVIVVLIIACISTIVILLRVYARSWVVRRDKVWGWEDSFIVAGYLAFFASGIFAVKAAYFGLGTRDTSLNDFLKVRCTEYLLYSQVLYGFSMPFIKASVMFTLLRITREKKYRWPLYGMLAVASIMALVGILASLLYCKPTRAYWNPLLGTCGNFMVVVNIGYAWTAVGIVTDWMCAIIPFLVVRKLQMARRTKTVVMIILSLGALASAATIVRAPYLQYYLATSNQLYWNGHIMIWCLVESGIGLIAACLPALRILVRTYLEPSKYGPGTKPRQYGQYGHSSNPKLNNSDVPLTNISGTGRTTVVAGKWRRLDDSGSDSRHIIEERTVTIDSESIDGKMHYQQRF